MKQQLDATTEEIKSKFCNLKTLDDLADLLDVPKSKLYYYAFKAKLDNHYKNFDIPKKSGGKRRILAPASPLKIIQKKISQVLQAVYYVKAPVQGFVQSRSILTNATRHLERGRKKFVFNADLEDFFPTISIFRVQNLLVATPYTLPPFVAETIARLTCYMGFLPQGAPSSPIISNMICAKMDTRLRKLAQANKCTYTRYADDITISTNRPTFPKEIASYDATQSMTIIGLDFQNAIQENGFKLNEKKARLQTKYKRQEITGLTVNAFPNVSRKFIRQIRAMLFAWEKYGYEKAQKEYLEKYRRPPYRQGISFKKVIRGKLDFLKMVKGPEDPVYLKFRDKLALLDPDFAAKIPKVESQSIFTMKVLTEGQSDWKHLKAALLNFRSNGEFLDLNIEFDETSDNKAIGDGTLLNRCKYGSIPLKTEICIFDRDKPEIIKHVNDGDTYKKWNSRMYSFSIPIPSHRPSPSSVCIELYYTDSDIKRKDKNGRRLFLSNEFHEKSGRHKDENLICNDSNKVRGKLTVIENAVYDIENRNVALPKNDFATYILDKVDGFTGVDFSEFKLIFDLLRKIARENKINLHIS